MTNTQTIIQMVTQDLSNRGCSNSVIMDEVVRDNYFDLQRCYLTLEIDDLLITIYRNIS